jgi:uncharacterized membrane protein
MADRVFEFLFKYRALLFQEGDVAFTTPWPLALLALGAGVVAVAAVVTYGGTGGRATPGERTVLATLRLTALGVLVFCMLQPTLVLTSVVPQRNFVGILLDDSRSMLLPGGDDRSRGAFLTTTFGDDGSPLVDALAERFALRFFRFSGDAGRVPSASALGFDGTRTDLASALDRAREELSSVPLSGLVVVSDGADNGGRALAEALVPLQAASVPVYTVGVGDEVLSPDLQVERIEVPRTVLRGSALVVDMVVTQHGYRGRDVTVVVEDGARRLVEDTLRLGADGEPSVARVRFTLDEPGPRRLRFRVPALEDEAVAENNARDVAVEVRERREKILYFEGEPRFEVKFLRRAVADDPNLQVVVLQRTAENKFLRLDVDDADELAGGFPRTREELFRYRGVVLGSVEASYFTHDQLQMLADFVSQRGGGLLTLGGRLAFAEGGYGGTALAEALPVYLEEPVSDARTAFTEVAVTPTLPGRTHPGAQLRTDEETPLEAWEALPPLSTLNRIVRVKPGATTLLTGEAPDGPRVVLAHHRYGRGRALALPVQDTWMWQMHADVPLDDTGHEVFWQQLLRWMVEGVPDMVEVRADLDRVEPGEAALVTATVLDSTYVEVNDARVEAVVANAAGQVFEVPLSWTVDADGVYQGEVRLPEAGDWTVSVAATRDGTTLGSGDLHLRAGPGDAEYFDAGRRTRTLGRLAEETGGRYYTPADVHRLPEDLSVTGAGVTLTEERDLWDMPVIFLLLLSLVAAEWGFRRLRGLV